MIKMTTTKPYGLNDIMSVQPLLQPTGLIYYLRYKYAQNKGTEAAEELKNMEIVVKRKKYRSIDDPWEIE